MADNGHKRKRAAVAGGRAAAGDGTSSAAARKQARVGDASSSSGLWRTKEHMSVTNVLAEAASSAAYEQEHKQANNAQIAVAAAAAAAAAAAGVVPDAAAVAHKKKQKAKKKKDAQAAASRVTVTVGRPTPSAAAAGAAAPAHAAGVAPAPAPGVPFAHSWKEKGAQFKKGHWKKEEDQHLLAAIDRYCESKGMNEQQKLALAEEHKHAPELRGAWLAIASDFTDRTVRSIYNRGVRLLHTGNYKGTWTQQEEEDLTRLVKELGPRWAQIGKRIKRMPSVARIKWERIKGGAKIRKGSWTSAEEQLLLQLVVQNNKDNKYLRSDINWQQVAQGIETRTASQCMTKWYATRLQMATVGGMWSAAEDARLVAAVATQNPTSKSSIDWSSLQVKQASQQCRKRFNSMLKQVPESVGPSFEAKLQFLIARNPAPDRPESDDEEVRARTSRAALAAAQHVATHTTGSVAAGGGASAAGRRRVTTANRPRVAAAPGAAVVGVNVVPAVATPARRLAGVTAPAAVHAAVPTIAAPTAPVATATTTVPRPTEDRSSV